MSTMPAPYVPAEPVRECRITEAPSVPTAVVKQSDFPMYEMATLMDGTFSHLGKALADIGISPIGPALSLHHRMPVDTADLEVGFPVDSPLTQPITLPNGYVVEGSELPGGKVAMISHVGSYDGLGQSWGAFTEDVGESDERMTFPFWELYVTEPSPGANPSAMRTDLFSALE